ncbi:phosphoribosylformylglycinamidine synthase subunit PurQ [Siminovitchia sp. 179-K 8D1 HS]|uniref:phosphoribosylformylglycinamidine synthase subunit PurQ n=1 Tax=Siminovitchia sp. 179-K 8D1 HS TaxID=3142385 RepID=UPI0039A2D1FB
MKIAIVVFPGTTCEADTYKALEQVTGVKADYVSRDQNDLDAYDVILLPGGAAYGDAIRPGAIAKRQPVMGAVKKAAAAGKPVFGIGNGFQILLEAGLLPGTLVQNEGLKFVCKQVELRVQNNDTLFTSLYKNGEKIKMPVAHKAGRYFCDEDTFKTLRDNHQIIFTYASENPNGSMGDIAGITNERRNVLGMMPHPERAIDTLLGSTDGVKLFQSIERNWRESHAANA